MVLLTNVFKGIKLNPTPLYILKRGYFHLEI